MTWLNKIKEGIRAVLKENPVSVGLFFVSFLFAAILSLEYDLGYPETIKNVLTFLQYLTLSLTPAFALCEINYLYKKKKGKVSSLLEIKKTCVYLIVLLVSFIISVIFSLFKVRFFVKSQTVLGFNIYQAENFFLRFFYFYLALSVFGALFFLYKKSGEALEAYAVKAFLGLMKGYLAYGVILLGFLCIIWVFQALIYEVDIAAFVMELITGLLAYAFCLLALSKPGEKISRFGQIMMGYVFPGILALAFVIVYVYIIKILVTWTFPSNKAFSIASALFAFGICIWTMAQGCTEGKYNNILRIFPLVYIPFIIIQIMCLYMRVHQYGLTGTRYLGILLIVFEILYEGYYAFRFMKGESLGGIVFPVLIFFVAVYFLIPGINVYAAVTASQRKALDAIVADIAAGNELKGQDIARAKSAYNEIDGGGGLEGSLYLKKIFSQVPREELEDKLYNGSLATSEDSKLMYASCEWPMLDISGYINLGNVDMSLYDTEIDPGKVPLYYNSSYNTFAEVDLSELVSRMEELYDSGAESEDYDELIKAPVRFNDENVLYIDYIGIEEDEIGKITSFNLRGIYLYN